MTGRFVDIFVGTKEIEQAVTTIGYIAISHARVEDCLSYLVWQLDSFEKAGRRSHRILSAEQLQARLREARREVKRRLIKQQVANISTALASGRVATRLYQVENGTEFTSTWQALAPQIIDLSDQRNEAVHSAIAWSAGGLVRTIGGTLNSNTVSLDLGRDHQLATDLGQLAINLGIFVTSLGIHLPFVGNDKIITVPTTLTT
jgi:hypothetical protein